MILKSIFLKVGDLGLPTEYTYSFLKRSRSLCNFIDREVLKKLKFRTDNFKRISIAVYEGDLKETYVNSSGVLCASLAYRKGEYDKMLPDYLNDYYIRQLVAGIDKCSVGYRVPKKEILVGIESYKSGGYINKWEHKVKRFGGITAKLICNLTMDKFCLYLYIAKDNRILFNQNILTTDPDENAFEYRFNDIKVEDKNIIVTSKISEPLKIVPLSEL